MRGAGRGGRAHLEVAQIPTVFVYGTLRYLPLLARVLGRAPDPVAAILSGHAVYWAQGEAHTVLREKPLQQVEGVALRGLSEGEKARLDFYQAVLRYWPQAMVIQTAAGPEQALVYIDEDGEPPGGPWSLPQWEARRGRLALEVAEEVMTGFGRQTPEQIAARMPMIEARAQSRQRAGQWCRPRYVGTAMGQRDIAVKDHGTPYAGFFTVEEYTLSHRLFSGRMSAPITRAVFRAADAVTVLPYDPVRDMVLMVEQFRLAVHVHGDPQPWLLEPVAGVIDPGDTPEETAHREAMEEAGIILSSLHHVASYYPTPGAVAQRLISYVALCDLGSAPLGTGGLEAEGEDIRSHLVPFDQAEAMFAAGALANAPLIISLQWLAARRADLRGAPETDPLAS